MLSQLETGTLVFGKTARNDICKQDSKSKTQTQVAFQTEFHSFIDFGDIGEINVSREGKESGNVCSYC